jgi:hypothetical protein
VESAPVLETGAETGIDAGINAGMGKTFLESMIGMSGVR